LYAKAIVFLAYFVNLLAVLNLERSFAKKCR